MSRSTPGLTARGSPVEGPRSNKGFEAPASVDRIICNPPFGKQLSQQEDIGPLYRRAIAEWDRVLKPGGRAVLLVADPQPLFDAIRFVGWSPQKQYRVRVLGLPAMMGVWRKREG